MVKAIIDISNEANRVLNIIKAKYGLRDKSEAINKVAKEYAEEILEPQLNPKYIKKMLKIKKHKAVPVKNIRKLMDID